MISPSFGTLWRPEAEAALGLAERDVELEHGHAGLARDAQQARGV